VDIGYGNTKIKRMKIKLLLLFTLLVNVANAQLDTSFWFVAPEVAQQHGDRPVVFRFATLANPATVTVLQPANPLFPAQTLNIPANSAQTLDLTTWIDMVENKPANTVLDFGFHITSTAQISAYYEVTPTCNCNPDIFSLKGKNSIGSTFFTPFQNFLNNASYARSAFNVVATEDNTTITITPSQNIIGHAAGIPFTITLNTGQTFCAEASSTSAGQHLSGSIVSSDKPVAVTLSDDTAEGTPYGGCADLMGDQLIPTDIIGKEHIAIKGYLNGPDKVYVLATQNTTSVSIDGTTVGTINAGQTYVHTLSNPTAYIESDKPCYVLHQSGFGCEVGEAILPPIVCTGSNIVAFTRSTNEFFAINLLVPAGDEGNFTFNGAPGIINAASFNFVPGTANAWMYAQIDASALIAQGQAARIENPNKFHMGLIHGGANSGCRFGYFSDFASFRYTIDVNDESLCEGEDLQLVSNNVPGAIYDWTGPNGFSATGDTITIGSILPGQSGEYILSGTTPGECSIVSDTILIDVTAIPEIPVIQNNGPVCEGDSLYFTQNVDPALTFEWFDESGNSLGNSDTILQLNAAAGTYTVQLIQTDGECAGPPSQISATVYEHPVLTDIGPYTACEGPIDIQAIVEETIGDPVNQFIWTDLTNNVFVSNGSAAITYLLEDAPYPVIALETFISTVTGCTDRDTTLVLVTPSITLDEVEMPNVITCNSDDVNDLYLIDTLFSVCHPYELLIMNRWGNVVFETSGNGDHFGGRDRGGDDLLPGVYFYLITSEGKSKHGSLTIVRD
jgi:hypothetical protein